MKLEIASTEVKWELILVMKRVLQQHRYHLLYLPIVTSALNHLQCNGNLSSNLDLISFAAWEKKGIRQTNKPKDLL